MPRWWRWGLTRTAQQTGRAGEHKKEKNDEKSRGWLAASSPSKSVDGSGAAHQAAPPTGCSPAPSAPRADRSQRAPAANQTASIGGGGASKAPTLRRTCQRRGGRAEVAAETRRQQDGADRVAAVDGDGGGLRRLRRPCGVARHSETAQCVVAEGLPMIAGQWG